MTEQQQSYNLGVDDRYHAVVEITFRTDLANGRRSAWDDCKPGYRSQFFYDGGGWVASFFFRQTSGYYLGKQQEQTFGS